MPQTPSRDHTLRASCTRHLNLHRPPKPEAWFARMAASPYAQLPYDQYGEGEAVQLLEERVAALLGKPAAVFAPKGTIAQLAALRAWTDRRGVRTVALHPKSHIDLDEGGAYERLHRLVPLRVGSDFAPFTVAQLGALRERVGALTVELPLRRAAFQLPPWAEWQGLGAWARERQVPLHLDGARLWSCSVHYDRSLAEIAAPADSVYVSLYKDLGGLGGCVLAGEEDFIADVQPWLARHGSRLYRAFPLVISALEGLDHQLPRIPAYVARARSLAAALAGLDGVQVVPNPPHTNGFQVHLAGHPDALMEAGRALARERQVWLFDAVRPSALPAVGLVDVQVGEATADFADAEIVGLFQEVIERARS